MSTKLANFFAICFWTWCIGFYVLLFWFFVFFLLIIVVFWAFYELPTLYDIFKFFLSILSFFFSLLKRLYYFFKLDFKKRVLLAWEDYRLNHEWTDFLPIKKTTKTDLVSLASTHKHVQFTFLENWIFENILWYNNIFNFVFNYLNLPNLPKILKNLLLRRFLRLLQIISIKIYPYFFLLFYFGLVYFCLFWYCFLWFHGEAVFYQHLPAPHIVNDVFGHIVREIFKP